jgi:hypothetical protein
LPTRITLFTDAIELLPCVIRSFDPAPRPLGRLGISHRPDGRLKPMRADAIERVPAGAV